MDSVLLLPNSEYEKDSDSDKVCIVHKYGHAKYGLLKTITTKRWEKIQEIKEIRSKDENERENQTLICDRIPSKIDTDRHGYHDFCYNCFINIRNIKRRVSLETESGEGCSKSKRIKIHTGSVLFPVQCLFCEKKVRWISEKTGKRKKDSLIKCVTRSAEASIKQSVLRKGDERLKVHVENADLIAREVWYHESCRKTYTRKPERNISKFTSEQDRMDFQGRKSHQSEEEEGHRQAFEYICQYVKEHIIEKSHVVRMSYLRELYLSFMQNHFPNHYNKNYKSQKLKSKLIAVFGIRITFWQRHEGTTDLVYSDELPKGHAVSAAFESATTDENTVIEAAMVIRRAVIDGHKENDALPWPPTNKDLQNDSVNLPVLLLTFLETLYTKDGKVKSENCRRRVNSTAQDICYNISKGKWTMPKHILTGMCVRHLTGSKQLINILNRQGHSVSHSFLLELETAICDSIQITPENLPPSIMRNNNHITHFCWDNFDINEETSSGAGTTHSTHGIVIQEIKSQPYIATQQTPEVEKTKKRSIKYAPQELEPCFISQKSTTPNIVTNKLSFDKNISCSVNVSNFLWILARYTMNEDGQSVPGWNGWLSQRSHMKDSLSIVDYMKPLNHPITDCATVHQVLKISQKASKDLEQEFTFVTFDLAVAKIAYSLVWHHQLVFNDVIIHLGVFHIISAYLKAIGKVLIGSGFEEIVVDSKVCASGSIVGVLRGTHYNRSIRVHKIVLEALERLLFSSFLHSVDVSTLMENAKQELQNILSESQSASAETAVQELAEEFFKFKQDVRQGKLGKTAQFWIQYCDFVWNILHCLRATKTNDLDLHIISLEKMCPLFFSMDHPNYARYLTAYILLLLNLETSHPGAKESLKENGFSVCRSSVPASRVAVDMTIEQTINRHAKSKGGIIGFSQNEAAYQRWCVTRHKRAGFVALLQKESGLDSKDDAHKENQLSQMRKSENDVKKMVQSFNTFLNPFDPSGSDKLVSLSSGLQATCDIEKDLLSLQQDGIQQYNTFIQERLVEKKISFHASIKKTNKKTFTSLTKTALVKTSKKQIVKMTAQRNIFGQLLVLSQENNVDLQKVMEYPLGPVPWALGTADGMPIKTDKAVLMHNLEDVSSYKSPPIGRNHIYIIDGNALFHSFNKVPETFGEVAKKVFNSLPQESKVHFLTDNYKDDSIKSIERIRRGTSHTYSIAGPTMKTPRVWKEFLKNDDNKKELINFILKEWQSDTYAHLLYNREIYFACDNQCFFLTSVDGKETDSRPVSNLSSSQEEADTLIILHGIQASKEAENEDLDIIVRSPDTDVFILLIAFCDKFKHPLYFETGSGNKRRTIHINILCEKHKDIQDSLLGLHAFTGCDVNSAFVQKGKKKPLTILSKSPEFISTFKQLGQKETPSESLVLQIESFVCHLYGKPAYSSTNKLRYDIVRQKYLLQGKTLLSSNHGIDISLLPPCQQALRKHILRANYQARIWRQADILQPDIPDPSGHGWTQSANGVLSIDWSQDLFPQQLVDVLHADQSQSVNEEERLTDDTEEEYSREDQNEEEHSSDSESSSSDEDE